MITTAKDSYWYRQTAQHMWRTFFKLSASPDRTDLTDAERNILSVCGKVFSERFPRSDQDIIRMYYTSRWGDDLYAVEDYSQKHQISASAIWTVVHRANRLVIKEIGII